MISTTISIRVEGKAIALITLVKHDDETDDDFFYRVRQAYNAISDGR